MSTIERGFLILDPLWWNNITTSFDARNKFFKLLYSCILHTNYSLFIYYSAVPQEDENCDTVNNIPNEFSDKMKESKNASHTRLTYKHINSIVKAYEIALDVIELLKKIPTFDIRFIPVKSDCLNHILKTIRSNGQMRLCSNSYKFCEQHGHLINCASTINEIFSSINQDYLHYITISSTDEYLNSFICNKFIDQLSFHGFLKFEILDNIVIPKWNNKPNVIIDNEDKRFLENTINRTLFAGTFDHLHPGHKVNITVATWYAKEMAIIGITDKSLIVNKTNKDILQDFSLRSANVLSFIFSLSPEISIAILRISNFVGGADIFEFDALIATPESIGNAYKINQLRLNRGSFPVQLVEVPFVYKPQLNPLIYGSNKRNRSCITFSSTELRENLKQNLGRSNTRTLFKDAIKKWLIQRIDKNTIPMIKCIIDMIDSFVDDMILEILYRWKAIYGNVKGKVIFESWLNAFIMYINSKELSYLEERNCFFKESESITIVLLYLVVTSNLIKRKKITLSSKIIDKMYLMLFTTIRNVIDEKKVCDRPEFCVPYIYCYSSIEKNIFFEKVENLEYDDFKIQHENFLKEHDSSFNMRDNENLNFEVINEDHYLSFGYILEKLMGYFQLKEIERRSLFQ